VDVRRDPDIPWTIVDHSHFESQTTCTDILPGFKDPVEVKHNTQCTVVVLPDSERLGKRQSAATVGIHATNGSDLDEVEVLGSFGGSDDGEKLNHFVMMALRFL
jgi:hypothetical protein